MSNRFSRQMLSLLLALLLAAAAFAAPARTLAAPWAGTGSWRSFVDDQSCEQLTLGVDSNSFEHSHENFGSTYALDEPFRSALLRLADQSEYQALLRFEKSPWAGSCYGIACTMAIARLTKDGVFDAGEGFLPHDMQPGARNYFDVGVPLQNRGARNYINYYMLSQMVGKSEKNAVWTARLKADAAGKMRYEDLTEMATAFMWLVRSGQPFNFGFYYPAGGGHAIVGCDYYITGNNMLYLKCYDENDRLSGDSAHFCFVILKIDGMDPDTGFPTAVSTPYKTRNGSDVLYRWNYDYSKNKYVAQQITNPDVRDVKQIYENLLAGGRVHNAASALSAAGPTLTLGDVERCCDNYTIRPFVNDANSTDGVRYADSSGALYRRPDETVDTPDPDDPGAVLPGTETVTYLPVPADAAQKTRPFAHMDAGAYRYTSYHEGDGTDLEIDLHEAGAVGGVQKTFDGFDLEITGNLPGASLEKGSKYTWVSGSDVATVRFCADGRLRDVLGATGGGRDLELYFGTRGALQNLDMFRFRMQSFGFLQVYDTEDLPQYANSVVLLTDGLADGFGFIFYKGALESDDYTADAGLWDDGEMWIKIQPATDPATGELGVCVWTQENTGVLPMFDGEPVFRSLHTHEPAVNVQTGSAAAGRTYTGTQYGPKDGAGLQTLADGSLRAAIDVPFARHTGVSVDGKPLQAGVDYDIEEADGTRVTLKPAFLSTLQDGLHLLRAHFTDGRYEGTFTTPLTRFAHRRNRWREAFRGGYIGIPALFMGWQKLAYDRLLSSSTAPRLAEVTMLR